MHAVVLGAFAVGHRRRRVCWPRCYPTPPLRYVGRGGRRVDAAVGRTRSRTRYRICAVDARIRCVCLSVFVQCLCVDANVLWCFVARCRCLPARDCSVHSPTLAHLSLVRDRLLLVADAMLTHGSDVFVTRNNRLHVHTHSEIVLHKH